MLGDDSFSSIIYLFTIEPFLLLAASMAWLVLAARASGVRRICHGIAFLLLFPIPVVAFAMPTAALIARHDAEDFITWQYRAEKYRTISKQPTEASLPHAIWRQWGFLSVWTEAYLVFDKADALASFAFRGGNVPGVPCGAWHVFPLQRQWYVVTLYSGQAWDACD